MARTRQTAAVAALALHIGAGRGMTMVERVGSGKGVWAVAISQPIKSMFFRRP